LEAIGINLPGLDYLDVNLLKGVTGEGMKSLSKCTNLQHLEIRTQFGDDCKNNDSISTLTQHCPYIEHLDLGKAVIDSIGLDALSALKHLKYLCVIPIEWHNTGSLDSVSGKSSEAHRKSSISNLASNCKFLEEFHIPWTEGIDDDIICTLAENCKSLRVVEWHNTGALDSVTGKSLEALGNNCRHLQKVHLDGGHNIGDDSLIAIANGCRFLTEIKLCRCQGVGDLGVNKLILQCPFLESVDLEKSKGPQRATLGHLKRLGMLTHKF